MVKNGYILIAALGVLCCSCSARIDGILRTDGSAEVNIRASLEPRMSSLIRSLSGSTGAGKDGLYINGPVIGESLSQAPGVQSAELGNTGPAAVAGTIRISRVNDFLVAAGGTGGNYRFVTYAQDRRGGSLTINLGLDQGPQMLSLLSADVSDYLSALMAPAATGEKLTRQEYLDLVTSVYGQGVSAEIAAAVVQISLRMPGQITSITGGTSSGNEARLSIPLTDLLVLEKPVRYDIRWE